MWKQLEIASNKLPTIFFLLTSLHLYKINFKQVIKSVNVI